MTREQIQEALRSLGIEPVSTNGDWVQAHCPFAATRHEKGTDKSASFGVVAGARSMYNCFACKSKGVFADLPLELSGDGKRDYGKLAQEFMIAEATGLVVQAETYESMEEVKALPEDVYGDLFPPADCEALDYLETRGISMDTADKLGVCWWPEDQYVMFPVRGFDGRLHGWTGRTYDPEKKAKVWNLKGMEKGCHLLGAEHCTCDRPIIVVEGLMVYARFHEWGIPDAMNMDVVAAMGSSLSFEQLDMLGQIGKPVYMFLDGDKAGRIGMWGDEKKGTEGALHVLSRSVRTHYVNYPKRITDPDDLTREQVIEMLEQAPVFARRRVRP